MPIIPLLLVLAGEPPATLESARARITAPALMARAATLASDAMTGRNAGTPGNDRAAAYLAEAVEQLGLEPRGQDGGYLDYFEFPLRFQGGSAHTQNVQALWRGADPALRNQVVVLGAHFDHVGQDGESDPGRIPGGDEHDTIWNGADDNASGSCALLGIAEALARSGLRPRRSILFLWFSAEEHGLYGSQHYVAVPVVPLERTELMINLDMVGRNPDKPVEVLGVRSARGPVLGKLIEDAGNATGLAMNVTHEPPEDDSDHATFLDHRVPAVFFFTGYHDDYHRNSDTADRLSGEQMQNVARTVLSLAVAAADLPERLRFDPDVRPKKLGIQLGVSVAESELAAFPQYASGGAIVVRHVEPGSVADHAGLAAQDILVEMDGQKFPAQGAREKLREILDAVQRGSPVPLAVVRAGKLIQLEATWPELDDD